MKNHLHAGASAHAVVRGLFQQHCSNLSVPQCSLHQLLLGLLHCFAWAGSATLNIAQHVPTKELGVQVGTAAVFLAGDRLLKCHSGKRALASLQLASDILMKWLFPDSCNFGRSSTGALCALTGVLCAQGLLLLKARAHTKHARQTGRLLTRPQRALFWPTELPASTMAEQSRAIDELLHLQLLAVQGARLDVSMYAASLDTAQLLYQWFGPSRYVGKTGLVRPSKPGTPGGSQRLWEHLLCMTRPHIKGAPVHRYTVFRRGNIRDMGFLVCRAGPSHLIGAAEMVEISRHCPPANVQGNRSLKRCRAIPRSRPPRSCRGPKAGKVEVGTFEGDPAGRQLAAASCKVARAKSWRDAFQHLDLVRVQRFNFHQAYAHVLQEWVAETGRFGPLNIYSRSKWKLLALYLGTFGYSIDWPLLDKHWKVACAACALWKRMKPWLPYRRRLVAMKKVDDELFGRGLPSCRGKVLTVPRASLVRPTRSALAAAVGKHPSMDSGVRSWVLSKLSVVAGSAKKFSDMQNCSGLSRKFDWNTLHCAVMENFQPSEPGHGAHRVEQNWTIPCRESRSSDLRAVRAAVFSARFLFPPWLQHWAENRAIKNVSQSRSWKKERAHWEKSSFEYQQLLQQFQRPPDFVICPDDKVKQSKWLIPISSYFLMFAFFVSTSLCWAEAELSLEEANAWVKLLLLSFIPAHLHKKLCISNTGWFLPYAYCSIKAKCFGPEGRTCTKPHHSCVRRIVSYAGWKARRCWRAAGRALTYVVKQVLQGDEVWSLKESRPSIDAGLARLIPSRVAGVCDRCGGPCAGLQGITGDAGQFFEAVQAKDACQAVAAVLDMAEQSGHQAVTIAGSQQQHCFLEVFVYRALLGCAVYTFNELYWMFCACACIKFAYTGNKVWTFTGLPIGGLLSKTATAFVLGLQEHRWNTEPHRRAQCLFDWPDRMWSHLVCRARYVDDILWLSFALCEKCLSEGVRCVYDVPFEVTKPDGNKLQWLDFVITLRPSVFYAYRRKPFLPIPPWAAGKQYAFGVLFGRVSRWQEMGLQPLEVLEAMVCLLFDFKRHGWNKKWLRKPVYRVAARCSGETCQLVLKGFRLCFLDA